MASTQKTDMELQMEIFALAKSFDELVKDMYNSSFSQTIVERKNELYSDYKRTNDGYLLLNTNDNSGILRTEIQKQQFTHSVIDMLGTKKYIFNPYFSEFISDTVVPTEQQNQQLQSDINDAQQQLLDAQVQINNLLQEVNSAINDKDNIKQNYDRIIQEINTNYVNLQQQYNQAQAKILELDAERIRVSRMFVTASNQSQQA